MFFGGETVARPVYKTVEVLLSDQFRSPAGRPTNCSEWGTWVPPISTKPERALCHGGKYDGHYYDPCPARNECREEAQRRAHRNDRRYLPMAPAGTRVLAQSPNYRTAQTVRPSDRFLARPAESGLAVIRSPTQSHSEAAKVIYRPPPDYPPAAATPYAAPRHPYVGGVSPTFIPEEGESTWARLGKNAVQGMFSAVGWHVFDYANHVDLFGRQKR